MGKLYKAAGIVAVIAAVSGLYLYERFVGFERKGLESRFPANTQAYVSISHLRKTILAFATDDQLLSLTDLGKAIAKALGDSLRTAEEDQPEIELDPALLKSLFAHFKTQLVIGALPPSSPEQLHPDILLATHFYGSPTDLEAVLQQLAQTYSNEEYSFTWTTEKRPDATLRHLQYAGLNQETLPVAPCWTVHDDVFFLATNSAAIDRILSPQQTSLADDIALRELPEIIGSPDLVVHLNLENALQLAESLVASSEYADNPLLRSISLPVLFAQLGLSDAKSMTAAIELSRDRPLYLGFRYKNRAGLLNAVEPSSQQPPPVPQLLSLQADEQLNLNPGSLVEILKTAVTKASPLSNIPYFALRSRLLSESGVDLEAALQTSFHHQTEFLQTLDVGTGRDEDGEVRQRIVLDFAARFRLTDEQSILSIIESQLPEFRNQFPDTFYQERRGDIRMLLFDSEPDASITSGRFAIAYDGDSLFIGSGTLKTLELLIAAEDVRIPASPAGVPQNAIGQGSLTLENLPSELRRLAHVLYQQLNPDKPIPEDFQTFDWDQLVALQTRRQAAAYDDRQGHAYRISQRVEP